MILAAGFGTRLQPITDSLPKALVPFMGKPMIEYAIKKMKEFGVEKIVVNVHHKREMMIDFFKQNNFGIPIIISDEKEEHLLTGGGIKNASQYFGGCEQVLVHNADVLSSLSYGKMINYHIKKNADITLSVRSTNDTRVLCFDKNLILTGWKNKITGDKIIAIQNSSPTEYGFNGIYVLNKKAISSLPVKKKFSIVDFFLDYTKDNRVIGFVDKSPYRFDLGSIEKIKIAEKYFIVVKNENK